MIKTIAKRLLAHQILLTAGVAAVAVVVGIIAASGGHFRLAFVAVIALQAVVVLQLLTLMRGPAASDSGAAQRIDEASTRILADIARARQAILSAVDEGSARR